MTTVTMVTHLRNGITVTGSPEERRAEAADAGTPFERLQDLAMTNPSLVLQNPAFELAVVTDPGFLTGMTEDALCALVRQPAFPPDLMVALAQRIRRLRGGGDRVAARIAVHPNAPREALDLVATDEPQARLHVRAAGAFGRPWMEVVQDILHPGASKMARLHLHTGDSRVVAALARHGCIDGDDPFCALVIGADGSRTQARYMRASREISESNLRRLLRDWATEAAKQRSAIAQHARRDPAAAEVERRMSRSDFCGELGPRDDAAQLALSSKMTDRKRATLAIGPRLPDELLRRLVGDRQWQVRAAVALRPQLSPDDANVLARDPDARVRAHLARYTPHRHLLDALARDPDLRVQYAVAFNPACSPEIEAIIADPDAIRQGMVHAWATGTPLEGNGLPIWKAEASDTWTADQAAILAMRHAYDALPKVAFVAGPRCPVEVLETQAQSACWWARVAVVRNPRTPDWVVQRLAGTDANWLVRAAALERLVDPPDASDLPEPIPAETCSERHMPGDVRAKLTTMRTGLRARKVEPVLAAIDEAIDDPQLRPLLLAGMLVSRTRVRLTSFSEIGRKVTYELRAAAEARVAARLGIKTPTEIAGT